MSTHTPGPWTRRSIPGHLFEINAPEGVVMRIRGGMMPTLADARVMVAAPDLLEALSDLIDVSAEGHADAMAEDETHDTAGCAFCAAVAILARATGTEVTP